MSPKKYIKYKEMHLRKNTSHSWKGLFI